MKGSFPTLTVGVAMKFALVVLVQSLGIISVAAADSATLKELVANTNRTGAVMLDQGYRGRFTEIVKAAPLPHEPEETFEFTHAWFNERGVGNFSPPESAIAVGINGRDEKGRVVPQYRSIAIYRKKLPTFDELKKWKTVKDFEKTFGPFRSITDGWGSPNEKHTSENWTAFTLSDGAAIRVVEVFLFTVNKGHGWEIEHRQIRAGIFRPTGQAPAFEKSSKME